ncbi:MAG: hypothetical protein NXH85_00940 [Pseudomonadaceae bacterium]|nr:hypothetical protein [Pseudomonadaceae bacterium]
MAKKAGKAGRQHNRKRSGRCVGVFALLRGTVMPTWGVVVKDRLKTYW